MTKPVYEAKAEFFKVLGHPARIQVLEVLRSGERSVSALVSEIGIESSHLSQLLGIMRRANIVQTRKEGATVIYSVIDRNLYQLLDVARCIITSSLTESQGLLDDLRAEVTGSPIISN
jgi:DNA-binding transcriptional ArsR family regulator